MTVLSRAFIVPVLAMATLFVGTLPSARVDADTTGVGRAQSGGLDAAALGDVNDAAGEEAEGDACERDWNTGSVVDGSGPATDAGRSLAVRRETVARRHCRAASLIRGPPLRG